MPSLKTFLSDQETKTDLLSNEAIAKTIVALLRERPDRPVTVGVHGDWGVGKSSILEMIEHCLESDENVLCLKFNGWRFQGFEDAKVALLEGIVEGLLEKRPALTKATSKVKDVFKRIDWLKVAKKAGGLAVTAMTGLPTFDVMEGAVNLAVSALRNPSEAGNATEAAIDGLLGLIKDGEPSKNVPSEVREFRKAFDDLLDEANISQLIVLVDDLDRCLPDTAIETLEAIRLFVFSSSTAFVIAADEAMIEYSVRKHFPDLPNSSGPQGYARNYLEKLIQVPFRIPALGEAETKIYIALALAQVNLGEDSAEFKALLSHAREVLRRPWLGAHLEDNAVKAALGERSSEAADLLVLSDRIGPILARGTRGNPRQVKRFLNTLLLRERIAEARGFGDDIKLPTVAKLLLAERFKPAFYDQLVLDAAGSSNGHSQTMTAMENPEAVDSEGDSSNEKSKGKVETKTSATATTTWLDDPWVQAWAQLDPKLANVDLRPYAFVANQQERMSTGTVLGPLMGIVNQLMGPQIAVAGLESEIGKLTLSEAKEVMAELTSRIRSSDLRTEPAGVAGFRTLLKVHPLLQSDTITFLQLLPIDSLGPWVVSGWTALLAAEKESFAQLLTSWAGSGNTTLAAAAKATQGAKGGAK